MDGIRAGQVFERIDDLFFRRQGKPAVDIGRDEVRPRIGIAHTGGVHAGSKLRTGKTDMRLSRPVERMTDHILILGEQVNHKFLCAAQQRQQVKRALIGAAHDEDVVAHHVHQPGAGLQPLAEPPVAHRLGQLQIVDLLE